MSSPLGGADACSRLSVPLAVGSVSIREVLARCAAERAMLAELPPGIRPVPLGAVDSLVSRLHWHCHFIQKLEMEPALETRSLHPAHERARVVTAADDPLLGAWTEGRTGLPFLDACMRSLRATGWLNFRMRAMVMAVASYQFGLDWQVCGERLAALFTDYEPGIHWPQVQMQAGQTGINTPRMYNPVKQGLEQDPAGVFTRRWVPEVAGLPTGVLQTPWLAGGPAPVVDLAAAGRTARQRLAAVRASAGYRAEAEAVYARHGSRARRLDEDDPRRKTPARQMVLDV
jgi:deoxyribodipyrimidine photo-lyase